MASELEREDRFPADIVEGMRQLGLFGITIPAAYGGLGLDLLTYVGVIEELAYGWMSLTGIVNTHTMAATLLMQHGREEQKERWLPGMASGERRGALSLSEPDAGSDTRNISCRAVRDGDEYVIRGTKAWVTNGERASIVALAARTDEGISAFIVEKEPGPELRGHLGQPPRRKARLQGRRDRRDGLRRPPHPGRRTSSVKPDGASPRSWVSSKSGASTSRPERSAWPGPPSTPPSSTPRHRTTFGKPIGEHQAIQLKLADMATHLEAARLLTVNAAERKAAGLRCDVEAGMAKLFASETALEIATEAMRIHGGVGYTTELPVERYYRDAPLMVIGEGTNEIQRLVIARGLLARARDRATGSLDRSPPRSIALAEHAARCAHRGPEPTSSAAGARRRS